VQFAHPLCRRLLLADGDTESGTDILASR
jgi:hypothetical protein